MPSTAKAGKAPAYDPPSWEKREVERARNLRALEYTSYPHAFGLAQGMILSLICIVRRADDERPGVIFHETLVNRLDQAMSLAEVSDGAELRHWLLTNRRWGEPRDIARGTEWIKGCEAAWLELTGLVQLADTLTRG